MTFFVVLGVVVVLLLGVAWLMQRARPGKIDPNGRTGMGGF